MIVLVVIYSKLLIGEYFIEFFEEVWMRIILVMLLWWEKIVKIMLSECGVFFFLFDICLLIWNICLIKLSYFILCFKGFLSLKKSRL